MSIYFALVGAVRISGLWTAWGRTGWDSVQVPGRGNWALWTAIEYGKGFGFWAFPWLLLGYTQARQPLFIQCADIGGVFLVVPAAW
jgi:apolipoprotein N-acyltransferase